MAEYSYNAEKYTLDGNADSVEFCPREGYEHVAACATYNLQEAAQPTRSGQIYLFQISRDTDEGVANKLQMLNTSGIFDLKWCPQELSTPPILGQASADGSLVLYSLEEFEVSPSESSALNPTDFSVASLRSKERSRDISRVQAKGAGSGSSEEPPPALKQLSSEMCGDAMCLSLDWDPFSDSSESRVVLSRSDGSLCTVELKQASLELDREWTAHTYEAWIASFDKWKPHVVYSGADDSMFCGWDLREDLSRPIFKDRSAHSMGVCCVQSSHLKEHLLCTGSYDEMVRLWDARHLSKPLISSQVSVGGGVWRLKFHPRDPSLLLAACMHNGFAILQLELGLGLDIGTEEGALEGAFAVAGVKVAEEYKGHSSLAYGADWYRGRSEIGVPCQGLVATCSFYDKSLHFWKPLTKAAM